jgi:A/G-specific adenine glycosylase
MDFGYLIIDWYRLNKRDLPWRQTRDPYKIWVSEVILQQTRVEQGLAYYQRFTHKFPDIESLAKAQEEEVMKIWQGLGYYSRALNMHQAAQSLFTDHQAKFPASYNEIIKMKGIGDYSASAISSIAFGEAHPVVDGNVKRVVARYEGISDPLNTTACRKKIKTFLNQHIDRRQPGIFNQAVMELGALVCKPKQPFCPGCPVRQGCFSFNNGRVAEFPVVTRSKPLKVRFFNYLVIIGGEGQEKFTWLRKRTLPDIWKNLYDFPLIETEIDFSLDEIQSCKEWEAIFGKFSVKAEPDLISSRHLLSHQELRITFLQVIADQFESNLFLKTMISNIHKFPVPRLIEKYFKKVGW